jgi:hypothetical protein
MAPPSRGRPSSLGRCNRYRTISWAELGNINSMFCLLYLQERQLQLQASIWILQEPLFCSEEPRSFNQFEMEWSRRLLGLAAAAAQRSPHLGSCPNCVYCRQRGHVCRRQQERAAAPLAMLGESSGVSSQRRGKGLSSW